MFVEEPCLEFTRGDHIPHQHVVGGIVSGLGCGRRKLVGFLEDDLVGFQQPSDLCSPVLTVPRRTRNAGQFGNIRSHRDSDATQKLNPFGQGIDQFGLLAEVLVKEQVELLEVGPGNLPVVLLVEIAQGKGVRKDLVQVGGAREPDLLGKADMEGLPNAAEVLDRIRF